MKENGVRLEILTHKTTGTHFYIHCTERERERKKKESERESNTLITRRSEENRKE